MRSAGVTGPSYALAGASCDVACARFAISQRDEHYNWHFHTWRLFFLRYLWRYNAVTVGIVGGRNSGGSTRYLMKGSTDGWPSTASSMADAGAAF